jgi:hypothetical protein
VQDQPCAPLVAELCDAIRLVARPEHADDADDPPETPEDLSRQLRRCLLTLQLASDRETIDQLAREAEADPAAAAKQAALRGASKKQTALKRALQAIA